MYDCCPAEEQEATPAQQEAFDLLRASPHRAAAAEVLTKVLLNIVDHPTDAKYRSDLLVVGIRRLRFRIFLFITCIRTTHLRATGLYHDSAFE